MPRLEPASPESSEALKEILDSIAASRGWVSNALRSLSHAPEGLRRFHAVGHYGRYDTDLSERERELVRRGF